MGLGMEIEMDCMKRGSYLTNLCINILRSHDRRGKIAFPHTMRKMSFYFSQSFIFLIISILEHTRILRARASPFGFELWTRNLDLVVRAALSASNWFRYTYLDVGTPANILPNGPVVHAR